MPYIQEWPLRIAASCWKRMNYHNLSIWSMKYDFLWDFLWSSLKFWVGWECFKFWGQSAQYYFLIKAKVLLQHRGLFFVVSFGCFWLCCKISDSGFYTLFNYLIVSFLTHTMCFLTNLRIFSIISKYLFC